MLIERPRGRHPRRATGGSTIGKASWTGVQRDGSSTTIATVLPVVVSALSRLAPPRPGEIESPFELATVIS